MIDILLLIIIVIVTWCVASEGAWGACILLFSVLFGGILATNYFEPFAAFLESVFASSGQWKYRWDFIAFSLLFGLFVTGVRVYSEYVMPTYMHTDGLTHDVVRWPTALITGYLTMAIILTSLHTACLPREFIGFTPERKNFFGIVAPDRQWLAYMQYLSENQLVRIDRPQIFDGPKYAVVPGQPEQIWPSFPIRYAFRRSEIEGGGSSINDPNSGELVVPNTPRRTGAPKF